MPPSAKPARSATERDLPSPIILNDQAPLAVGKTQSVYQHPGAPDLLIKVRKLDRLQRNYDRKLGGLIGYKRRHGLYTTWMRELEHYFSVCLRLGYQPQFLQRYHGIIDTDLGLGMAVERIADRSGSLAPKLEAVVKRSGLTAELRAKVEHLARQVNELRISTNDISMTNIVYGWDDVAKEDRLVLIEGIGVNTFVPLARYSNFFNVRSNDRHFARTLRSMEKLDRQRGQQILR
jgi:hypothetical protein